jgi:hypothetical protein
MPSSLPLTIGIGLRLLNERERTPQVRPADALLYLLPAFLGAGDDWSEEQEAVAGVDACKRLQECLGELGTGLDATERERLDYVLAELSQTQPADGPGEHHS